MFTGIVVEQGEVRSAEPAAAGVDLAISAPAIASDARVGDSVSIDGCCLTVVAASDGELAFDVVPESLRRTALDAVMPGAEVNVEPALRVGEALGGHYVQGHVDEVGRIRSIESTEDGVRMWIDAPEGVLRYCVEKGSVAVQGVALTITALDDDGFEVALVPHTLAATTLAGLEPGAPVNLEVDVLAKYVERLVTPAPR